MGFIVLCLVIFLNNPHYYYHFEIFKKYRKISFIQINTFDVYTWKANELPDCKQSKPFFLVGNLSVFHVCFACKFYLYTIIPWYDIIKQLRVRLFTLYRYDIVYYQCSVYSCNCFWAHSIYFIFFSLEAIDMARI